MKIAEVSEKYGIPQDTLRYYEREGVIPEIKRGNGNIRDYTEDDCKEIAFAQCLKSAGFTVEEIVEYRNLSKRGDETIPDRLALMQRKREDLLQQREALDKALKLLDHKVFCYERAVETGLLSLPDPDFELGDRFSSCLRTSSWRRPGTRCDPTCRTTASRPRDGPRDSAGCSPGHARPSTPTP